jgi:hypothetical protein
VKYGPIVTDAAPCTFLHEGREPDFRCECEKSSVEDDNRPFPTPAALAAKRRPIKAKKGYDGLWVTAAAVGVGWKFVCSGSPLATTMNEIALDAVSRKVL